MCTFCFFLSKQRKASLMEDDDDLELLRLAALKSLKKEVPTKPLNIIAESHVIPVVSNVRPVVDKFYAPGEPELVQPNLIHHPVPPYINSVFEKMEITETYVPQRLNPPVASFSEFVPFGGASATVGVMDPTANVQLSPRSAAFVFHCQNKQITKRRQGLSPSPRLSPGRWSRSPSPESWKYRRSKSRSPTYPNHSPHFRNRSVSRSPHRRRHSPQPVNVRRNKTRSPIARNNERNNFEANAHRVERRSPGPNRRANSPPNNRHPARPWRAHSSQCENGVHARKSGSPRGDDTVNRRRRTRSPNPIANVNANANFNAKLDVRRRSTSRSPNRKYPRNNLNRPPRRTSPSKRFNAINKPGGARNRNYNRRSPNLHRRSHSPPNNHKRRSPTRNMAENGGTTSKNHGKELTSDGHEKPLQETKENETNESGSKEKTNQNIENKLHASSDSENSDNDDGIDLFASEESESENEGRFKLSSSRSERKANVPVVSFSELGKATTAPADVLLRDLDELQTDTNNTQKRSGGRRENDRNRNSRRDDRRFNRDRDRENKDRNRDRENRGRIERRGRDREREIESGKPKSSGSFKYAKHEDSRKKDDIDVDAKGDRKPNLFKQTFTSVDSEHRTKTPDAGIIIIINVFNKN